MTINTNSALFAFWGGGGQQFLGGGVMVNTGLESIGAFGVGKNSHTQACLNLCVRLVLI